MAAACVRAKLPRRDGASGRARVAPTADPSSCREASIGQCAPPRPMCHHHHHRGFIRGGQLGMPDRTHGHLSSGAELAQQRSVCPCVIAHGSGAARRSAVECDHRGLRRV